MASFAESVFQIFSDLQKLHRFVPARAGSGKTFASMVQSYAPDIVVYLFVSDGRPSHANVDVNLWVAPPDDPGDGLDALYVGYRIRIASEFNVDEHFFINCQKRIITLLPSVKCFVAPIRSELAEPAFKTRRYFSYHIERKALATVLRVAKENDTTVLAVVETVRQLARGKSKIDGIFEACMPLAEHMLGRGYFANDYVDLCRQNVRSIANSIGAQLYISSLCEQSERLRTSIE